MIRCALLRAPSEAEGAAVGQVGGGKGGVFADTQAGGLGGLGWGWGMGWRALD